MRIRSHTDRENRIKWARSTLIDALRLVDDGKTNECVVAAAMALAFLGPITDYPAVYGIVKQLSKIAERREALVMRPIKTEATGRTEDAKGTDES